ncbi:efflux RND transporter periplasmic adaptor subunit [Lachnospiraceae bacterium 54-53]
MKKKKVLIIAGAIVIAAAAAGLILPRILGNKEEIVADVPPAVTVEKPEVRSIELSNELIGTIEPDSIVYVTPLGSGEITNISVQTGDRVSAGQLLCVIDTKQVESSRISAETARITYEDARKNLDRYSVLYAAGDVAEADYQSLVDKAEMAKLQYENAKIAYDIQLESSQITAPIAGRVESLSVKLHDMVSPQTTLCVISGDGGKAVTFYVTERVVSGLKAGDTIQVEKSGTRHEAAITEVSTMIDEESGLFKVKASVPTGENLATGTSVKLYVISQRADNVLTVPVDSVYYEGGKPFIYTYIDGILKQNEVTIGLADDAYAEVQEGITADDQVVTTWTREMFDGSRVTLVDAAGQEQAEEGQTEEGQTAEETGETETEGTAAETSSSAQ